MPPTAKTLDLPVHHWACPACPQTARTQKAEVHTEMHDCPAHGGLGIPLVEVDRPGAGADARHVPVLNEDLVFTAIRTEHGSGRVDCTVFLGLPATFGSKE